MQPGHWPWASSDALAPMDGIEEFLTGSRARLGTERIRAVREIVASLGSLGLPIRSGLHAGEIEVRDDIIGGIAVYIGARVADLARPGEVLVSSTVKDLVAGRGIDFEDRGAHELKGVPTRGSSSRSPPPEEGRSHGEDARRRGRDRRVARASAARSAVPAVGRARDRAGRARRDR